MSVLYILAATGAFFIKGMCGFANTLVFSTILSFQVNNVNISPMELILGYPSNVIIAWRERRAVDWKVCVPLALLVLAGNIPGVLFLKLGSTQLIKVVFGFVVAAIGLEMFIREFGHRKSQSSKIVLAVIGILSGILSGLFGIGALLAAYVSRTTDTTSAFKANLCIVFVVENTFRIILYAVTGIFTYAILKQAVCLVPFMLFGLWAGMQAAKKMNDRLVKKGVCLLLVLSGISLVVNNIR